eukprot:SAG22_NODE_117_length_19289_cov_12.242574_7_plen_409_part_00
MQAVDLSPRGGPVAWVGAMSVEQVEGRGLTAWRLPHNDTDRFAPMPGQAGLLDVAMQHSGVRLIFTSDTARIRLVCQARHDHMDCVYDLRHQASGELVASHREPAADPIPDGKPWHQLEKFLAGDPAEALLGYQQATEAAKARAPPPVHEVIFEGLQSAGGQHVYELWLPHAASVFVRSLEVGSGAVLLPVVDSRPRWLTHGSSITHCSEAYGPSRTWPATAARLADVNLCSLGYGGQCHLDQAVARMIRDEPADIISLKLGINLHNMTSASHRTFAALAVGFIETIREGHPTTPIVLISPIWAAWRETGSGGPNPFLPMAAAHPSFPTLVQMRAALARVVEVLRAAGDSNLFYLSGLELCSAADAAMMPDLLHPNGELYELLGQRFAAKAFGPAGVLLPGRCSAASM